MDRKEIAKILEEVAGLLDLKGENSFKVRAYENAARAVLALEGDIGEAVRSRELLQVRGIGSSIFAGIEALVLTGHMPLHDELRATLPAGLADFLRVPGLGARKAKALHDALGVASLEELEKACLEGRLEGLKGFGPKSVANILKGIALLRVSAGSFHYHTARRKADELLAALSATRLATRVSIAGSLRRRKEIIRDIDLLAVSKKPEELARAFRELPGVTDIIGSGETKTSVRFADGLAADLRVVADDEFPAALLYFTGSKEHNTALRGRARKMGFKLNEYGLFREDGDKRVRCGSEEEIFGKLGLAYIEPELREDRGEIEAAEAGTLPVLLGDKDLKGLIHLHTTESDGRDTLEKMIEAVRDAGLFLRRHDRPQQDGCLRRRADGRQGREAARRDPEAALEVSRFPDLPRHRGGHPGRRIDRLRRRFPGGLRSRRGLRALPVRPLGRGADPTARPRRAKPARLGARAPLRAIAARARGVYRRLGESDRRRRRIGLRDRDQCITSPARPRLAPLPSGHGKGRAALASNPDAHSAEGLADTAYGVGIARKGWVTAKETLNAKTARQLETWLEKRRGKALPPT